jgi:hypothetical protein
MIHPGSQWQANVEPEVPMKNSGSRDKQYLGPDFSIPVADVKGRPVLVTYFSFTLGLRKWDRRLMRCVKNQ